MTSFPYHCQKIRDMIKVLQIGMGPLGIKIAQFIAERPGIETVAAIDLAPSLQGKTLDNLAADLSNQVAIQADLAGAVEQCQPDVAVVTTVSDMQRISPLLLQVIELGLPIVSTCEELSYPWSEAPEWSAKIDTAAKAKGVAVLGTGVNPGFLMDSLPTFLTSICQKVEKIEIRRYQNASVRRIPFQQKIGAGLDLEAFEAKRKTGTLRHVGLTESIQFIAAQMAWKLDQTEDILSPVVAKAALVTPDMKVPAGNATGVRQIGRGLVDGIEKIRLEFQAAVDEAESYDEVIITGTPNVHSRIAGGVHGDVATCAITVNACKRILSAQAGLRTMADVGITSFFAA